MVTFKSLSDLGLSKALSLDLLGEKFYMRGQTLTGIIDDVTASEMFAAGGAIPSEPISITFKKRVFRPALELGSSLTARGKSYIVRQIVSDEISFTLICEVPGKR